MAKIGIALVLAAVAGGVLVVVASGARDRGRDTYCRNNLRKLGQLAWDRLKSDDERTTGGRAFWQEVRQDKFTNVIGGKESWIVRFGGLNPFGCPVRGVQPLDLAALEPEAYARLMSDVKTIDYRGPRIPAASPPSRPEVVGGDLEGNHPRGGGHVLFADLSVGRVLDALVVKPVGEAPESAGQLSE
ncbi:MAG TPA: hypothetical protein VFS19_00175 [Planctomycetota bacterium]|nr:hypothetical protein [Planctomycetota bacterium]